MSSNGRARGAPYHPRGNTYSANWVQTMVVRPVPPSTTRDASLPNAPGIQRTALRAARDLSRSAAQIDAFSQRAKRPQSAARTLREGYGTIGNTSMNGASLALRPSSRPAPLAMTWGWASAVGTW